MHETRSERTERLLTMRLEELARALERARAPRLAAGRLLELASAATLNAVALELVTAERAEAVWSAARERHPVLDEVELRTSTGQVEPPARAAA